MIKNSLYAAFFLLKQCKSQLFRSPYVIRAKMPGSIGVNLRVTGHCRQGGRKYMEDFFSVAYQQTEDEKDLEYAFFGIYDGHGGAEAAAFAKEHLMETIIKHKNFWSDSDEDVLRAIKDGYIATHYAMWKEQEKWPKTASGLPSTAGTTASVAFIRRGKIYIGHVGDSGIILGYQEAGSPEWKAKPLTKDHKPENADEMRRIESCGGKVVAKSGVPRVVWNRPRIGHQGPVRRSTPIDEIPFLAVARSLGDLWSYNSQINRFIVSPVPDCSVLKIDTNLHRCLIFGTDGLYNMLTPTMAVHIVQQAEKHNENATLSDSSYKTWLNPSKLLVDKALERWHATKMRADNTSVVTLMLDPPGPPRAQVLKDRKKNLPESGLKIVTRYDGANAQPKNCNSCSKNMQNCSSKPTAATSETTTVLEDANENVDCPKPGSNCDPDERLSISSTDLSNYPLKEHNYVPKPRESTSFDPREPQRQSFDNGKENSQKVEDNTIQINEISSSNIEDSGLEEESEEHVPRSSKPNLRSTSRSKSLPPKSRKEEVDATKGKKRKLSGSEMSPTVRKSLRLSSINSTAEATTKKVAPCTLAEEKLKKLAEDAEKEKQKKMEETNKQPKMSLAQRILRTKKLELKKKNLLKRPVTQKKIKMVVNNIMQKTKPIAETRKTSEIPASSTINTSQSRQNKRDSFQARNQEVAETSNEKCKQLDAKKGSKDVPVVERRSIRCSDRLSGISRNAPEETQKVHNRDVPVNKPKLHLRKSTLRLRLQQKTASLKRCVIRK